MVNIFDINMCLTRFLGLYRSNVAEFNRRLAKWRDMHPEHIKFDKRSESRHVLTCPGRQIASDQNDFSLFYTEIMHFAKSWPTLAWPDRFKTDFSLW